MKAWFTLAVIIAMSFTAFSQNVTTSEWQKLIPSEKLPKSVKTKASNNNLDLVKFNGRYYFAFRTAPTHFASRKTRLYILSSTNLEDWQLEQEIFHGRDMREPRFVEYQGKLFFYFFDASKSPFKFDPQKIWVRELDPEKGWQAERDAQLDGYVPWRLRTRNDTIYMSAYYGKDIYNDKHKSDLRLFTSTDGYQWKPLTEMPQIARKHAEEGEFIFDKQGNLWATIRLEGEGAMIAYADKNNLGTWKVNYSKYKYDSALMFAQGDDIYVISRRNVDGEMAQAPEWMSQKAQDKLNLIKYWITTKKTALFKLDKEKMELVHVVDFPSTGDTAFPGITQEDENSFVVMNYSSNIHDKMRNWFSGQLGKTYIYWTTLQIQDEAGTGFLPDENTK